MTMRKVCAVRRCKNSFPTFIGSKKSMFVPVPTNAKMRKKWLKAIGEEETIRKTLFICQDHFDLPNDMTNYMMYCVNGSVTRMNIKSNAVPSKFDCLNEPESRITIISHKSTQTCEELWDIIKTEVDPLAITEDDYNNNCGSSTFDEGLIKLEKIKTEEDGENTYYVVL